MQQPSRSVDVLNVQRNPELNCKTVSRVSRDDLNAQRKPEAKRVQYNESHKGSGDTWRQRQCKQIKKDVNPIQPPQSNVTHYPIVPTQKLQFLDLQEDKYHKANKLRKMWNRRYNHNYSNLIHNLVVSTQPTQFLDFQKYKQKQLYCTKVKWKHYL